MFVFIKWNVQIVGYVKLGLCHPVWSKYVQMLPIILFNILIIIPLCRSHQARAARYNVRDRGDGIEVRKHLVTFSCLICR